jgi:hypothetical protein
MCVLVSGGPASAAHAQMLLHTHYTLWHKAVSSSDADWQPTTANKQCCDESDSGGPLLSW